MKTSGSKREYLVNGRYADDRHAKTSLAFEDLPHHEPIKTTKKFYNGKINYGLLVRFLRGQVGQDWDGVYAEVLGRIPAKLLDYREMIFWFVAEKVVFREGKLWNKHTQKPIWTGENTGPIGPYHETKVLPEFFEFYVHPDTNKLTRIEQRAFKRITRKKD